MDFRDLKYFEVIAAEGNLGRAAERLHRTQPALTKCIDRLEEALGARLFEKDGRGMRLTEAGQVLVRRTRQMGIMVEDTAREMQDYAKGLQGNVRVGCQPSLTEHLMPAIFEQLLAEAPAVSVNLVVSTNDNLVKGLKDGDLDLVLGPMLESDVDFACESIAEDTVVVMAGENHPLFRAPCMLADLHKYKWMLAPRAVASRQWLEQTLERHGSPQPLVQIESNVVNSILPVLERTQLLGFVTRLKLVPGKLRVREVDLPEVQMERRLGLMYRKSAYLSPVATRLAQILRAQGKRSLLI